jgi:peroxiredoxin
MKKLLLFMLAASPALTFAQEKYVIKGTVGTLNAPAKLYLSYRADGKTVTDSSAVNNGAFQFIGEVKDITRASIVVDYKGVGVTNIERPYDVATVYLVKGTTRITSPDSLVHAQITGTKVNEDNTKYTAFLKPVNDANKALSAEYYAASKEKRSSKDFGDYIDKKEDSIAVKEKNLDSLYILANPASYMSLQALRGIAGPYPDVNQLETKFDKLSKKLRESTAGVTYQKYLATLKTVMIGATAPDFTQADTNGNPVALSSFKGKYLLVDFWASWCGPCRAENPNVVKAYNNYKGKNFTILGVSLDRPGKKDAWLKAIHNDGLAWNHVSDLKFWDNDAAKLYGIQAIPQNLLIDPTGKIIGKNLFGDDLEKKLAELFGAPMMGALGK